MAKLINGNGNKAIWAAQDADLIASICGNITSIAAVGSQFSYTQEDANTIGVSDGVIITKEGRRIQLDTDAIDLFTIPTGVLGATSYYIIGYKLVQAADTVQTCETFVQKMDNSTDVIPEDTFKGGATEVYVSLYRVTQDGMNIDTVDLLLPKLSNIAQLINDLTANNNKFIFAYDSTSQSYGYKAGGADTFHPFRGISSIKTVQFSKVTSTDAGGSTSFTVTASELGLDEIIGMTEGSIYFSPQVVTTAGGRVTLNISANRKTCTVNAHLNYGGGSPTTSIKFIGF